MLKVVAGWAGLNWNWESNPQYLAQVGHFLGGLSIVFVLGAFKGHTFMWWTYGILIGVTAAKEFIWDVAKPPYGEGDSWSDSLMDWIFWVLGSRAGMGLFLGAVARHAAFV